MVMVKAGGSACMDITDSGDTWNETCANGHLVASAPEMYEAIKQFRAYFFGHEGACNSEQIATLLDAVLSRAEGRTP